MGGVGVEPTHPEGTVLQTAATLRLRRPPIFSYWQAPKDLNSDRTGWNRVCYHYTRGLCSLRPSSRILTNKLLYLRVNISFTLAPKFVPFHRAKSTEQTLSTYSKILANQINGFAYLRCDVDKLNCILIRYKLYFYSHNSFLSFFIKTNQVLALDCQTVHLLDLDYLRRTHPYYHYDSNRS